MEEQFEKLLYSKDEDKILQALQIGQTNPKLQAIIEELEDLGETLFEYGGFELEEMLCWNYVTFSQARLTHLPKSVGHLRNLNILDLFDNQISELPEEIWNLVNLKELDLGANQFSSIPKEIGKLQKLEELTLRINKFTSFPKKVVSLKNLKVLHLAENQIDSLPKDI